jgi:hypothetical protein
VPSIRSREVACVQRSRVGHREDALQPLDFSNALFCVHPPISIANGLRSGFGYYAASAPTLQCAPSESTNCASTPPKSCFLGGMLKSTPFALMSR